MKNRRKTPKNRKKCPHDFNFQISVCVDLENLKFVNLDKYVYDLCKYPQKILGINSFMSFRGSLLA